VTIKELSQLYYLNREIERDKARLDELYAKATSAAPTVTGMPRASGVTDRVSKYAAEIADLKGIIDANVQRCFYELNRLNRYTNGISDSLTRTIFQLRFVSGLSWDQVSACVGGRNTPESVRKRVMRYLKKTCP
jgi:hypothetical protein